MAKKKQKDTKQAGDYEVPVALGDTDVVIMVRMNGDVRQRTNELTDQMRYQRGISNTQTVNMLHEDVARILRTSGIEVNNLKGGRRERIKVNSVTEAVRGFHYNGLVATRFHAMMIAMMSDAFETDGNGNLRPKLRQDIAALIAPDDIAELSEAHFKEPDYDDEQYKYMPYPFTPDKVVPAEHMYVLTIAITQTYPNIWEQLQEGRDRFAEMERLEGGVQTDPNNFLPSTVD